VELLAIGVTLWKAAVKAEALQAHGVTTGAIFSDSLAAIGQTAHLDPGPGQQPVRAIDEHARALPAQGIDMVMHCVPGHTGIPMHNQPDRQVNKAREGRRYTVCDRICTSAANSAKRISEVSTAAKAKWEAKRCSMP